MRIAMVSEHANPLAALGGVDAGGQNVHVAALAGHLVRRGHEVTVFTRRDDVTSPWRVETPDGYAVELVPAGPPSDVPKDELVPYLPDFARYLATRWATQPYDIVHSHFWMSGLVALAAAAPLGIGVVHTFHALGSVKRRHQGAGDTSPPGRIVLERHLCGHADHVIATCTDEVNELHALGMPEGGATVIPCGVDAELFRPAPPRVDPRPGRLLMVGRLVPRKGGAEAVRALARIPDVELVIAGGPSADALSVDPEVRRLRRIAAADGTAHRVRFLGRVPHEAMPALFHDCDVVVSVPWYEPFGIVPVEAMASGRPVVGSAVGGLLDTVLPGITGDLVPPRDPDRLATVLRNLLRDVRRRARYGRAGARRARVTYRWSAVAKQTERVYAAVAARRSGVSIAASGERSDRRAEPTSHARGRASTVGAIAVGGPAVGGSATNPESAARAAEVGAGLAVGSATGAAVGPGTAAGSAAAGAVAAWQVAGALDAGCRAITPTEVTR